MVAATAAAKSPPSMRFSIAPSSKIPAWKPSSQRPLRQPGEIEPIHLAHKLDEGARAVIERRLALFAAGGGGVADGARGMEVLGGAAEAGRPVGVQPPELGLPGDARRHGRPGPI